MRKTERYKDIKTEKKINKETRYPTTEERQKNREINMRDRINDYILTRPETQLYLVVRLRERESVCDRSEGERGRGRKNEIKTKHFKHRI